jgi:hypothetical protein
MPQAKQAQAYAPAARQLDMQGLRLRQYFTLNVGESSGRVLRWS